MIKDVTDKYTVEVHNRLKLLQSLGTINSAHTLYSNITKAHEYATSKHVPKKLTRKKNAPWEYPKVIDKRERLKDAYTRITKFVICIEDDLVAYNGAKQELKDALPTRSGKIH